MKNTTYGTFVLSVVHYYYIKRILKCQYFFIKIGRVMNDLYIKNPDESKVSKVEIKKLAEEKYSELAGLAQQYLFYWKRENG